MICCEELSGVKVWYETGWAYPQFFDAEDGGNIFFCETFVFTEETTVAQPRPPCLRFAVFMHLSKALYYQKECAVRTINLTTECMATEGSDSSILGVK